MTSTIEHVQQLLAAREAKATRSPKAPKQEERPAAAEHRQSAVFDTPDAITAWIEARRDPAWKHQPYKVPVSRVVPRPPKAELVEHIKQFEYHAHTERRHLTQEEREDLGLFMAALADPKYKPWVLPKPRAAKFSMTVGERRAEEKRVADFVASRK